jgi:hypothetical protein
MCLKTIISLENFSKLKINGNVELIEDRLTTPEINALGNRKVYKKLEKYLKKQAKEKMQI